MFSYKINCIMYTGVIFILFCNKITKLKFSDYVVSTDSSIIGGC